MNYLKILLFAVFIIGHGTISAIAHETSQVQPTPTIQQRTDANDDCLQQTLALAQRGCCSHHGGVCGCDISGRKKCCDGTLSPSCTCTALLEDSTDL